MPAPPGVDVRLGFEPLDAEAREELDWFLEDADRVRRSRLARNLAEMGGAPVVELHPYAGGGGEGVISTRSLHEEVRDATFPTLRKLRTESARGSIRRVHNILGLACGEVQTEDAQRVRAYLSDVAAALREANHGRAVLSFRVRSAAGDRAYATHGDVLDWRQNARTFHNAGRRGERELRRDYDSFPEELIDPAVDGGLRLIAELTLGLAELVKAVLDEQALVLR